MKIGKTDIGKKLFVAPLAEVSYAPFRKIAKKFGAGVCFTQMSSADGLLKNNFRTLRFFVFHESEKPLGVQLLGNDPEILGEVVSEISKRQPTLIDLNSGCPVTKVRKNNLGSSLLDNPDLLSKCIRKMVDNSNGVPISVKIRIKDSIEDSINIAKLCEDSGAEVLFVHARTVKDSYIMPAKWHYLTEIKKNIEIPVVGNGSVYEPKDALEMIKTTGVDSVMVARGALGNPFLFSRFNTLLETGTDPGHPDVNIVKETALEHLNLLIKECGEYEGIRRAKKNLIWYFRFFEGIEIFANEILKIKEFDKLLNYIDLHIDKIENKEYPKADFDKVNSRFLEKVFFWTN